MAFTALNVTSVTPTVKLSGCGDGAGGGGCGDTSVAATGGGGAGEGELRDVLGERQLGDRDLVPDRARLLLGDLGLE